MESFTDEAGETFKVREGEDGSLTLISDYSSGVSFFREDALKIIALITKAAA